MRQCCKAIVNNSLIQPRGLSVRHRRSFPFPGCRARVLHRRLCAEGATPADMQLLPARLRYWSYFVDAEVSTTRSISTISTADVLSSVDQLGQFLSSIEHTCFYSRGWHVENLRHFVDRLLVVIDQVDDLTMLDRQSHQRSAHQFAPILFLQCDFRVIRRIRDGGLDFFVQFGAFCSPTTCRQGLMASNRH